MRDRRHTRVSSSLGEESAFLLGFPKLLGFPSLDGPLAKQESSGKHEDLWMGRD